MVEPETATTCISLWERTGGDLPHTRRTIATGERVSSAGEALNRVVFPIDAIFIQARQGTDDDAPLAITMVGGEGMLGWSLMLGADEWKHDAFAVVAGELVEVGASDLIAATEATPALRTLLLRYIHNQVLQLTQHTVANLRHSVECRLARWLVMFHDRRAGDEMLLTHDTLAMLLNVRRASVTSALHMLEGERLLRCTRGRIVVRDRAGLQAAAGDSYGFAEGDYNLAIGPFGKSSAAVQQT